MRFKNPSTICALASLDLMVPLPEQARGGITVALLNRGIAPDLSGRPNAALKLRA